MRKRIGIFLIGATICALCLEFGHGFVAKVEAVVGRPLTPVSVAGVARRTSRRCAVGVYDC
jgi:hypothetical protein